MRCYLLLSFCYLVIAMNTSFANDNFDIIIQCENCSSNIMKSEAKNSVNGNIFKSVLVFSIESKKIEAYQVESVFEEETNFEHTIKFITPISISSTITSQFTAFADKVKKLKYNGTIDIPKTICQSTSCLNDYDGLGTVSLFLRSEFNINITTHVIIRRIFGRIINTFQVKACFSDGECILIRLKDPFSSFSFVPISSASFDADIESNYNISKNNFPIRQWKCVRWVNFYQSGKKLYSWCSKYELVQDPV